MDIQTEYIKINFSLTSASTSFTHCSAGLCPTLITDITRLLGQTSSASWVNIFHPRVYSQQNFQGKLKCFTPKVPAGRPGRVVGTHDITH